MCNKVLLIILATFYLSSALGTTSVSFNNPMDVQRYMEEQVRLLQTQKTNTAKVNKLKQIKDVLDKKKDEQFNISEKTYDKIIELKKLDQLTSTQKSELEKLNVQFELEKSIHGAVINYRYAFGSIFSLFIDKKKSLDLNCDTISTLISGSYLNASPEGTALPHHAKLAITLADHLCSTQNKPENK